MKKKQNLPRSILRNLNSIMSVKFKLKDSFSIITEALENANIEISNRKSLKFETLAYIRMRMNRDRRLKRQKARKKKMAANKC